MDKDLIIKVLQGQLQLQLRLNDEQHAMIRMLEARIIELENNQKRDSSNSSKPPSSDIGRVQHTKILRTKSGKKPGGQRGHSGQTLLFSPTPDQVIVHGISRCSCCGKHLCGSTVAHYECRRVFDIPPIKRTKTQNMIERFKQYKDEVLAFATNFLVPFGNNIAEQAVRMMKVKQKISGCFRSQQGAHDFADIGSYIATIKKRYLHHRNPWCCNQWLSFLLIGLNSYLFFIFLTSQATAQVPKLYNHIANDVHVIHSRVLNQDRQIYINVPQLDSADLNKALPVLYLLDGENHFHILSAYMEYLRHWQVIPPIIVVGIVSVDRVKDLTPTKSLINFDGKVDSNYKTSGGNEQFLNFIQQELMPYMEVNYKAGPFKIFAGHSFGGLTVINCMLTRPDMFGAYIAISPSLWFGNKYVLRLAEQKLPKLSIRDKKLFYSVGGEGGTFRDDLLKFDKLFNQNSWKKFEHEYKYYPSEDHMTEPIPAYYDALRFVYKNWKYNTTK